MSNYTQYRSLPDTIQNLKHRLQAILNKIESNPEKFHSRSIETIHSFTET